MKIRNGFVSNSSSSSFVIAYKGNLEEELDKALKLPVPENYPLRELIVELADAFHINVNETFKDMASYKKGGYDEDDSEVKELFEKGFTVAVGSFEDIEAVEAFLCNQDIDYESDTLVIKQEGGY
jgi:hypothetical protein